MAAEKWDAVRNSGTVTLHEMVTKAYGECSTRQCILVGIILVLRNTTDSGASKYNNFREIKLHTGKCCTLRIENAGESGACSMPTGAQ